MHAVQQFLGLGNYFKHYIQSYVQLVAPLHRLTQKPEFAGAAKTAFEHLKYCLSHEPVLVLRDPKLPFETVVDACDFACGAAFLQSYKFSSAERNYPIGERELLAVITALQQWRCHLEGAEEVRVVITIFHKPNAFLDSKASVQLSRDKCTGSSLILSGSVGRAVLMCG